MYICINIYVYTRRLILEKNRLEKMIESDLPY